MSLQNSLPLGTGCNSKCVLFSDFYKTSALPLQTQSIQAAIAGLGEKIEQKLCVHFKLCHCQLQSLF